MKKGEERVPFSLPRLSEDEMKDKLDAMYRHLSQRRSVRSFSPEPVPMDVLEKAIQIAGTAPSGAHKQPWSFCVVTHADLRKQIRLAVEKEELLSYEERMPQQWLEDLQPLGTDHVKPYIEEAPALIVVFKRVYDLSKDQGKRHPNYYVSESCGIAAGLLISALHAAGLATLTHTPSPMNFLAEILGRPDNERAFLNIPVGWPASDATVPNLFRKPLNEILIHYPNPEIK